MVEGNETRGTVGRANELQLLVNQQARATMGCFRRPIKECCRWSLDSDRQPRNWRTGSGDSDCASSAYRRGIRLEKWWPRRPSSDDGPPMPLATQGGWRTQSCSRGGRPSIPSCCKRRRPKPRLRKKGRGRGSLCSEMGPERRMGLPGTRWFGRMTKPGRAPRPIRATVKRHIAALRRARPGIIIEIRWHPAHNGAEVNGKADEWAKLAAEEPDTRGVE